MKKRTLLTLPKPVLAFAVGCGLGLLAAWGSGCSGKSVDENDPAALMKEAEEEIQSDHYQLAVDRLRMVKNKFPYSKYAVEAQLRIADVYFMQESFAEAAVAYETFRDLHPKHEKTGYAMFRLAKSYFNDMPSTVARDMTSGVKAEEAYHEYLKKYPSAPESEEAHKDLVAARRTLAEKEMYVARFYLKREQPDSARARFEKILALYPETEVAKEAKSLVATLPPPQPRKKE